MQGKRESGEQNHLYCLLWLIIYTVHRVFLYCFNYCRIVQIFHQRQQCEHFYCNQNKIVCTEFFLFICVRIIVHWFEESRSKAFEKQEIISRNCWSKYADLFLASCIARWTNFKTIKEKLNSLISANQIIRRNNTFDIVEYIYISCKHLCCLHLPFA